MAGTRAEQLRSLLLHVLALSFALSLEAQARARAQPIPQGCAAGGPPAFCTNALAYFVAPNVTPPVMFTYGDVAAYFNSDLLHLLEANNEDLSMLSTFGGTTIAASKALRVPLAACSCKGGAFTTDNITYIVQPADGLFAIASNNYGGLVQYQDIAMANGISDPNLILVGQVLIIPLPCGCLNSAESSPAVALSYVVQAEDTYSFIANEFHTTADSVGLLNPTVNASALTVGQVLEVPLPACFFNLSSESLDSGLLVPYKSYFITANGCVQCQCTNSSPPTGTCVPAPVSIPCFAALTCVGTNLTIGSFSTSQTSTASCEVTTCLYAGYTPTQILTRIETKTITGTCPVAPAPAPKSAIPPTSGGEGAPQLSPAPSPESTPPTSGGASSPAPRSSSSITPSPPTVPGNRNNAPLEAPGPSQASQPDRLVMMIMLVAFATLASHLAI